MCIHHNHYPMCSRFNITTLSYMSGATNPVGLNFYKQLKDISILTMAFNKVIRNVLKFHLTLVGQSNPSLERNAKLRGLKAGEDLSCLIKLTQYT